MIINVYKGEGRILVIPVIGCKTADWFVSMPDTEGYLEVGRAVLDALDLIRKSSISKGTSGERDTIPAWKKNTKYKSWVSFWKHNHHVQMKISDDGQYNIYSLKRSEERQGLYTECLKKIYLPADADAEEIGQTVLDVLEASEAYYHDHKETDSWRKKTVELLDGSTLTITYPRDRHFEDCGDCNVAEIYQCYEYHTQEGSESSADFFLGIAPELDCSLEEANVLASWEHVYGKVDSFEMKEADHGIFKLRAEMRNKSCHKVSYFLQTAEDLLLECGMQVHHPGRRKKLDERLAILFEEFAGECRF